jgi:hypothetical protein
MRRSLRLKNPGVAVGRQVTRDDDFLPVNRQ